MTRALPVVDPNHPIADGFAFDETEGLSVEQINRMASGGKVFLTEFRGVCGGRISKFGGRLTAQTWDEAEDEAARRGLGEKVIGVLHSVIPA